MQSLINLFKRFFSIFLAIGNNAADSIEGQVNILKQKVREEEIKIQKAESALTDVMGQLELVKADEREAQAKRERYEQKVAAAHAQGNEADVKAFLQAAKEWGDQEKIYEENMAILEQTVSQLTQTVDDAINRIGKANNEIKAVTAQAKANSASLSVAKAMSDLDSDGLTGTLKAVKDKANQDGAKARAMLKRQDDRTSVEDKAKAYDSVSDDAYLQSILNKGA